MTYRYVALITDVHDGDSVTADIDLGFKTWQRGVKIRLLGINAPELNTYAGKTVAAWLRAELLGKVVQIETVKNKSNVDQTEKYGRWLGTIWQSDSDDDITSINERMLAHGLAVQMPK